MDSETQRRTLELRKEIAELQSQNESYREQQRHTNLDTYKHELRRQRLLAIKEELAKLSGRSRADDAPRQGWVT